MEMMERVKASLLAVMAGDAIGMPFETLTPEKILEATGGAGVHGMHDPVQRLIHDTKGFRRGMTTDDWQFTEIVGISLVVCDDFDLFDQARMHAEALEHSTLGMGGTTLASLCEVLKFFRARAGNRSDAPPAGIVALGRKKHLEAWAKAEPRDPRAPARRRDDNPGIGNGIIMKVAPIPLYCALRQGGFEPEPMLTQVIELGRLTHWDLRASIGAYAVAVVIAKVLHQPLVSGLDGPPDTDRFLDEVIAEVRIAERRYGFIQWDTDSISSRLHHMKSFYRDPVLLRNEVGTEGDSRTSAAFTIGTFLRRFTNLPLGLREAVEAGGDTDTNAAIVGSMIGANLGGLPDGQLAADQIPSDWLEALPGRGKPALELGERLYRVAMNGSPKDRVEIVRR
jgi:ADP-ribosylglycohydrolase